MANKRRIATTLGAMALTAVLAVGGTLAYLSMVTDTKENKFTSSKGLGGKITEDGWDYTDDTWSDYIPGESTAKDPRVEIDNKGVYAAVGMQIECIGNDNTPISFEEFARKYANVSYQDGQGNWHDGVNPMWVRQAETDFYTYNTTVAPGSKTDPIFQRVTINEGIVKVYGTTTDTQKYISYDVDEDGNEIPGTRVETTGTVLVGEYTKAFVKDADGNLKEIDVNKVDASLPKFQINVTGFAIQAENQLDVTATSATEIAQLVALKDANATK